MAVALVLAWLYGSTLCPTVYWYDSAEFAAMAVDLGVPHPPGYPLYILLAHLFTYLPFEPALALNLMSLLFGIGGALLVYWVCAYRLAPGPKPQLIGGAVAALTLGISHTYWANSVVAEVYTVGLFFSLSVFALLIEAAHRGRDRWVVLAGFLGGLGVGVHMSIATLGLGYVWLILVHPPAISRRSFCQRTKLALKAAAASLAGLMIFLYVPLSVRAHGAWGSLHNLYALIAAKTFQSFFLDDYDFLPRLHKLWLILVDELHFAGLLLVVLGVAWLLRKSRHRAIALLLGAFGNLYWFFNYEVHDPEVFFLPAIAIGAIFIGIAAQAIVRTLTTIHRWAPALGLCVLALPGYFVDKNYKRVDLSGNYEAAIYGDAICAQIEDDAVLVHYSSPREWRLYSVFLYQHLA
ncbi:MAG TPA: DUF2723 domain-containing protein, partial [Nannocystis exedens]|nr:DUF2723 domain-containing protein [Nannocystis exedens]